MVLLIDSNVILDVLQNREPHYEFSAKVIGICGLSNEIKAVVSTLAFANIVYIMRKELNAEKIESVYKSLSKIFTFEDFKNSDIQAAAKLRWKDFESEKIPVVTPKEFLKIFELRGNK